MIVVKSTMNKRDAMKFNLGALKRVWWLFALIFVMFVILGVFNIVNPMEDGDEIAGYVMIGLAVIIPIAIIGFGVLFTKISIKSSKFITDDMQQTFSFSDENIHIEQQSSLLKSDSVFDWSLIYKVTEFKDTIYIYISNMQSLIININNFVEGSFDSLKALLIVKCGNKFKALKNKR